MPRTRTQTPKDDKVDEIAAAAERRLAEGGYPALSVAAIAREIGVAQNAVYWYFPSKDHLFIAAVRRMLAGIARRKGSRTMDTTERVLWFVDEFAQLSSLRPALTERARQSPVAAEFVAELDATLSRMLANAFRGRVPDRDVPKAVAAFRAAAEGTFVLDLTARDRRRVLRFLFDRLTAES